MMMTRMKKIPVILVVCMLLFSSMAAEDTLGPTECCFSFYTKRIPKDYVVTFERTGIHCATDAVVFTTKKGAKLCVDITQDWVQKTISYVEARAAV